jgi:hypothetical protein
VTHLRQLMLDELQRRNYSPSTVRCYIHAVEDFSKHFHRSPERLGPSHIREYQVHMFRDRKLSAGTFQSRCAALRFLFVKTLRRPYLLDEIPFPKPPRKLPTVLSPEEVTRLIDSARNLIPAGGLALDGSRWIDSSPRFFLPFRALSEVFRGKFCEQLREVFQQNRLQFHGSLEQLAAPGAFSHLLWQLIVALGQSR